MILILLLILLNVINANPNRRIKIDPFKAKTLLNERYESTGEIIGMGGYGSVLKAKDQWDRSEGGNREFAIKVMFSSNNFKMPETLHRIINKHHQEQGQQAMPGLVLAEPVFNQSTNQYFYLMRPVIQTTAVNQQPVGPSGVSPRQIEREVRNMQKAQICPQTVRLYDTFKSADKSATFLVMPVMQTSLFDLIYSQQLFGMGSAIRLRHIRALARKIFEAAACLHENQIIHNDLKPQNILLSMPHGQNPDIRYDLKLTDFGLSIASPADQKEFNRVTDFYEAPEITLGMPSSEKSDVWSIGVTLAELVTGRMLFPVTNVDQDFRLYLMAKFWLFRETFPNDTRHIMQRIDTNPMEFYAREAHYDLPSAATTETFMFNSRYNKHWDNLRDLVLRCLKLDPRYRISVDAALKHPFFKE